MKVVGYTPPVNFKNVADWPTPEEVKAAGPQPSQPHKPIKMWTDHVPVEDKAMHQLFETASMPFIHRHIAVMPDVHLGMGATVGSVIPTIGAVMPAAVGVDINCGMMAVKTSLRSEDVPEVIHPAIRAAIEKQVPNGRTCDGGPGDRGAWGSAPSFVQKIWDKDLLKGFGDMVEKYPSAGAKNNVNHLGTLGTGNHFVELCLDEEQNVWIMLHSGSRGPGNRIGTYFTSLAQKKCKEWFVDLPNKDLAYFPEGTDEFDDYLASVNWATEYAIRNREIMLLSIMEALGTIGEIPNFKVEPTINCNHNYLAVERHFGENVIVTRKGAISAQEGQLGIIPGSMGTRSFIVKGKGNRDAFCSASHGAGRVMSRTEARKTFTKEQHFEDTKGVECLKDDTVLDETPRAYKRIEDVMLSQDDLVEAVAVLKQFLCVKGPSDKGKRGKKKNKEVGHS
jgi:tRNA-splicing ligase RtcB